MRIETLDLVIIVAYLVGRLWTNTSEAQLVRIGRITAVVVMLVAMAWSTQGKHFGGIFAGLNQMIACLAPPITAVFLLGVFWPRGTSQAAFCTLLGGFLLGIIVFVADFPAFGFEFISTPFMLQAWWLFVLCCGLFVMVSLMTARPTAEQVDGLCWPNPLAALTSEPLRSIRDPRVLALLLVVLMFSLYWLFA